VGRNVVEKYFLIMFTKENLKFRKKLQNAFATIRTKRFFFKDNNQTLSILFYKSKSIDGFSNI